MMRMLLAAGTAALALVAIPLGAQADEFSVSCPRGAAVELSVPTNTDETPNVFAKSPQIVGVTCLDGRPDVYYTIRGLEGPGFGSIDSVTLFLRKAATIFGKQKTAGN
jgi:hypothetical protein